MTSPRMACWMSKLTGSVPEASFREGERLQWAVPDRDGRVPIVRLKRKDLREGAKARRFFCEKVNCSPAKAGVHHLYAGQKTAVRWTRLRVMDQRRVGHAQHVQASSGGRRGPSLLRGGTAYFLGAAGFFATAFFAGAFFFTAAFFFPFAGPFAARASISATASSAVIASGSAVFGKVALVVPSVT